jgi:phage shock protein E
LLNSPDICILDKYIFPLYYPSGGEYSMKRTFIFLITIYLSFTAGMVMTAEKQSKVKEKISKGALVVDVRTPEEFREGHYKDAINIPLSDIPARLKEFGDTSNPVIVYCRSGRRSAEAKKILTEKGFKDITDAGGLTDMPQ